MRGAHPSSSRPNNDCSAGTEISGVLNGYALGSGIYFQRLDIEWVDEVIEAESTANRVESYRVRRQAQRYACRERGTKKKGFAESDGITDPTDQKPVLTEARNAEGELTIRAGDQRLLRRACRIEENDACTNDWL